jgi:hypothetical protein
MDAMTPKAGLQRPQAIAIISGISGKPTIGPCSSAGREKQVRRGNG